MPHGSGQGGGSAGRTANAGSGYLRSTVTTADLAADMYISSQTRFAFDRRVDTAYWRFYARFPNIAPGQEFGGYP